MKNRNFLPFLSEDIKGLKEQRTNTHMMLIQGEVYVNPLFLQYDRIFEKEYFEDLINKAQADNSLSREKLQKLYDMEDFEKDIEGLSIPVNVKKEGGHLTMLIADIEEFKMEISPDGFIVKQGPDYLETLAHNIINNSIL